MSSKLKSKSFEDLEYEIRDAFHEQYTKVFLDHLGKDSSGINNLPELLWMGFAHGYLAKINSEETANERFVD